MTVTIEEKLGVIDSFELPDNWRLDPLLDLGQRKISVFRSEVSDDVLFCHMYREAPLSRVDSERFQTVLYAPFHELSDDEIADLAPVLEGLANKEVFAIKQADTNYLNARRMIRVRGDWLDRGISVMSMFIDNGGKGERVQNVYFAAPTDHFHQFEKIADEIFRSIKWRASSV